MSSEIHEIAPCPICGETHTLHFYATKCIDGGYEFIDSTTGSWEPYHARTCNGKIMCWDCEVEVSEYVEDWIDLDGDLTPLLNACIDKWNRICRCDEERENVI